MLEVYNNTKEMALAFKDNKLIFVNEAGQYYFKSYAFILSGEDISRFMDTECLKKLSDKFSEKEKFSADLILSDGKEHKFEINFLTDDDGEEIVLYINVDKPKEIDENILRAAKPKSLYDPLKIGKSEIYKNHLSTIVNKGLKELDFLSESAIIKRNTALNESVNRLKSIISEFSGVSRHVVDELSTPDGNLVLAKYVFSLNEMLCKITGRLENYIKMENLNITLSFTARQSDISISASYYSLMQAITGLIYNSCQYVLASGRMGRIGVKLYCENDDAIIEITDNGIGLSEDTFDGINEEERDISFLTGEKKRNFLNLQVINSNIRINNGVLTLENLKTKGSKAVIRLPLLSKTYSALRQKSYVYGIDEEIDKILRNGIIHM